MESVTIRHHSRGLRDPSMAIMAAGTVLRGLSRAAGQMGTGQSGKGKKLEDPTLWGEI